jgi:hypothetical protein
VTQEFAAKEKAKKTAQPTANLALDEAYTGGVSGGWWVEDQWLAKECGDCSAAPRRLRLLHLALYDSSSYHQGRYLPAILQREE